MTDNREKLFSDFPEVTTQEWMDRIQTDLKGADYEKKLVWKTNEGFNVRPFYRREDLEELKTIDSLPGEFPYLRGVYSSRYPCGKSFRSQSACSCLTQQRG